MSRLFSSMVTLSNGTDASSFTAKSDGVSSVLYKNVMYTYGGQVHDKVWGLNLGALKWTQHQCTGYIPFARSHHSAVQYSNYMLVYGGVLEQEGAEEPDSTPYYELDTDTFDWMRVQTFGESPGLRSHHAAITSGSKMYVLGGQDTSLGKDHALTAGDVQRSRAGGFYETFVLDVPSRTWSRPETTGTAPLLWGHTAVAFNQYILVYGGFDVTPEPESSGVVTSSPDSPPNCTLNEKVYILDTNTMVWRTSTPSAHSPAPASRTLHVSVVAGAEMVVFGGMTFESSGRAINVNDAWVWDIASGRWSKLEFCIPYWPSKKLLCVVHEGRLIVCHDLQSVHVLDFTDRRAGWVTYPVDPTLMFDARPTPSTPHPALPPPPAELPPPPPPQPAEAAAPVAETPELPPALPPAAAEPPAAAAQPPHEPEDFYYDHYSEPAAAAAAAAPATPYYPPEPAPPVYYDHAAELHQPHPQPGDPHAALVPSPHRRVSSPARPAGAPLPPAPEVVRAPPPAPAPAGPSPRAQRVQDEMLARQAEMLREAERARQAAAVAKLQREMDDLRSELTGLSALKEKLNHSSAARAANVAGSTSPVRGHGGTFPVPVPDTAHNQHQYVQVNAMKDYLDTLHTQQHSVLMEQKARHGAYVNDLQATHEEHMKMLRERARTQGTAAQQVEAIASTADLEGKLREQLDEVRKQYDAMLELQRAPAYLQPAHRDAGGSAYPEEAEDMVQMINKLSAIPKAALGARGPSATPGPANPFAFNVPPAAPAAAAASASIPRFHPEPPIPSPARPPGASVPPALPSNTLHTGLPFAQPGGAPAVAPLGAHQLNHANPMLAVLQGRGPSPVPQGPAAAAAQPAYAPAAPTLPQRPPQAPPANLPQRKAQHLDGLRDTLQAMQHTVAEPVGVDGNPRVSPRRGFSMASSSPGPYWDRLKDILGDDYVAVGGGDSSIGSMGNLLSPSHAGSPQPFRGEMSLESDAKGLRVI